MIENKIDFLIHNELMLNASADINIKHRSSGNIAPTKTTARKYSPRTL